MPDPEASSSSDEENPAQDSTPRLQSMPMREQDSGARAANPGQDCGETLLDATNPEAGLSEKQTVMLKAAMREDSKSSSGDSSPSRKSSVGLNAQDSSDHEDFELITEDELHKADKELLNP